MICNIISVEKRERENQLPYYVVKAEHIEGETIDPKDLFNGGMINVKAVFSRKQNFTKTLFPPTAEICEALDSGYNIEEPNTPVMQTGMQIGLKLIRMNAPSPYNIVDVATGDFISEEKVEQRVADKAMRVGTRMLKAGDTYEETVSVPKVYKEIVHVVLCDENENCIEGNEEELLRYQWNRRLNETWFPVADNGDI